MPCRCRYSGLAQTTRRTVVSGIDTSDVSSRYGVFPLAGSLDHIGPMCRSAADAATMLGVIAGADVNDPTALQAPVPNYLAGIGGGIRRIRIGVDRRYTQEGTIRR